MYEITSIHYRITYTDNREGSAYNHIREKCESLTKDQIDDIIINSIIFI